MYLSPAEYVIRLFGGVRLTARALNVTPSTVSKWKHNNGGIPRPKMRLILDIAKQKKININPEFLIKGTEIEDEDEY